MTKFKNKYRIESNRWQNWDYSSNGAYFITICVENHENILGKIENETMILSEYGNIVKLEILQISTYFSGVIVDEWVVMPDHLHIIIVLNNVGNTDNMGNTVETIHELSLQSNNELSPQQYQQQRRQMIIPKIIGKFKMKTSKQMNIYRNTQGHKNWQSDYYDRIIRDYTEHQLIKKYIINNPKNWKNGTL